MINIIDTLPIEVPDLPESSTNQLVLQSVVTQAYTPVMSRPAYLNPPQHDRLVFFLVWLLALIVPPLVLLWRQL